MDLRPPTSKAGQAGLDAFRQAAKLHELSLTNRAYRELYRATLRRWMAYYATLASKRAPGGVEAEHFSSLSKACSELLHEYGPEAPPKRRPPKVAATARIVYPNFDDRSTRRLHFLEGESARRRRASALLPYAPFVSKQTSPRGRVLASVGMPQDQVLLYERFVETLGDSLFSDWRTAGFDTEYRNDRRPGEPLTTWELVIADNHRARSYGWQARVLGEHYKGYDGLGLPNDVPEPSEVRLWDPDERYRQILAMTDTNQLGEALAIVETIPSVDREALLDEVVYLRFLTGSSIQATDIRLLARKHASNSLVSGRLLDEFDAFLALIEREFWDDRPNLADLSRLRPEFGVGMLPVPPPASDWVAYRAHCETLNSSHPRGRIFPVNIEVGYSDIERLVAGHIALAEDAFRRARGLPEIGASGWTSELALLGVFRALWPNTVHQWRPSFLGRQSIDIYVPEINLAVEYQGQQHYEPISLFGGEAGFAAVQIRDERKRWLIEGNGVRLLEWRYDRTISRDEVVWQLGELGIAIPSRL